MFTEKDPEEFTGVGKLQLSGSKNDFYLFNGLSK